MPEWIGKIIGNVRIDKYLAHGGMAEVYLGTHLSLERPVAIKVLHSYIEEDPDLLARFQREARVVAALRHPNIVQIFDFDTSDGHPYIVMEYLKGPTLSTYLRRLHEHNERIPHHQVARLLKVLTAALDYAHGQGVIHRDIKPANILLHGKADEIPLDQPITSDVEAVLTDFGLVRIEHAASQTASGMISGTPSYMSPEQARGEKTDHRTDIYSLGVVLYEMLAGRVPFEADSSMSVIYMQINEPPPPIAGIPAAVQAVMNRALVKNPNARYQSSREMAVDFFLAIGMNAEAQTISATLPDRTRIVEAPAAVEPPPPVEPKRSRSRMWIGAAIVSFICLAVIALGGIGVFSGLSIFSKPHETSSPGITPQVSSASAGSESGPPSAEGMVKISAGTYQVGLSPADEWHVASQSISLDEYWIDQYQTTNSEYKELMDATGAPAPVFWPAGDKQPVRGVSWDQAVAYCSWMSKRLPTEAEWEAAGRGPGINPPLYPWGNDATNGGKTLTLPDQDTYEIGSQSFNISPSKVYDLVGNVWEWVDEPYGSVQDGFKVLRGGRFGLPEDLAYRLATEPTDDRYVKFAGFRCASDKVR